MKELAVFQTLTSILVVLFLFYGMDVRRKEGTRDFVAPAWQTLMKLCAFSLIGAFVGIAMSIAHVNLFDWVALALMAAGTGFAAGAKRALGNAHTFTGQCLEKPRLVTRGVFGVTRNPLYFGVFLCESGAALFLARQVPLLWPQSYPYWLAALAAALAYAVAFNLRMALKEARYLEDCFGDAYRAYRERVPFLIPSFAPGQETQ